MLLKLSTDTVVLTLYQSTALQSFAGRDNDASARGSEMR